MNQVAVKLPADQDGLKIALLYHTKYRLNTVKDVEEINDKDSLRIHNVYVGTYL